MNIRDILLIFESNLKFFDETQCKACIWNTIDFSNKIIYAYKIVYAPNFEEAAGDTASVNDVVTRYRTTQSDKPLSK
jgi:hypothetical protein